MSLKALSAPPVEMAAQQELWVAVAADLSLDVDSLAWDSSLSLCLCVSGIGDILATDCSPLHSLCGVWNPLCRNFHIRLQLLANALRSCGNDWHVSHS